MKIKEIAIEYLEDAVDIAYKAYQEECKYVKELYEQDYIEKIRKSIEPLFRSGKGVICLDEGNLLGYLCYDHKWESKDVINITVPIIGNGAIITNRSKILFLLFQHIAEKECGGKKVHFEIKVYAHDVEAIKLLSYLQFGIQCTETIRNTNEMICTEKQNMIFELSKSEIEDRWNEIWQLYRNLVLHLQKSPIFYPGTEFTEEIYKEYIMDDATRLFIAIKNDSIIGILDANSDGNNFITAEEDTYNIGDIFVSLEYRGYGVSQQLLQYVNDTLRNEGVNRIWVEHGTANPNARGFWDKYFNSYLFTLIRDI